MVVEGEGFPLLPSSAQVCGSLWEALVGRGPAQGILSWFSFLP